MGNGNRKPTYEELLEENKRLRGEIRALKAALKKAKEEIEDLQRASKRQAAPFRRRESNKKGNDEKSSPGRKPGHKASYRSKPDNVDEERNVPLDGCPHCGGEVSDVELVEQTIEEIPPLQAKRIRIVTRSGWCPHCGKRVRSRDPDQVSEATGCASVHLGRRALALAAYLKYVMGLTYRKISDMMKIFGIRITPGGLVQALHRTARKMVPSWIEIWEEIRAGPVAHSDETSWYVGEPGWWLWTFCNPKWTLYLVDQSRGSDVVDRTLEDFEGTLVSDCLSTYDPIECKKQKCYSHHLKALSGDIQMLPEEAGKVLKEVRLMLRSAMALGKAREDMPSDKFTYHRDCLEKWADRLLDKHYMAPGVEKALHRFRNHREDLFRFLYEQNVPATNNLAERQLRPAVIARKLSCGNKTDKGRITWQILASIAATCQQQGKSFLDFIAEAMPLNASFPKLKLSAG